VPRLSQLPPGALVAIGCFVCLVLGFALLAQVNLWHNVGPGEPPTGEDVLRKYHGDPDRSLLDGVLDPAVPLTAKHNMWQYLSTQGPDDPAIAERRAEILGWVRAGAPEEGWPKVAPYFTQIEYCGSCHVEGGERQDLPLTTYAEVLPVAETGRLKPLAPLLISAHNHLFGFAVLAVLLSLLLCMTRVAGMPRIVLILAANGGAALDIGSWFMTRAWGSPFHMLIMVGGGLFGLATTLMALLVLRDVVAGLRAAGDGSPDGGA
jgi:hypothetical protein